MDKNSERQAAILIERAVRDANAEQAMGGLMVTGAWGVWRVGALAREKGPQRVFFRRRRNVWQRANVAGAVQCSEI